MIKYIHLDYRTPRSQKERDSFAVSEVDDRTANVFVNRHMHRKGNNLIDTFFHEMTHVFLAFHGKDDQMSSAKEEKLAKEIGRLCARVLK